MRKTIATILMGLIISAPIRIGELSAGGHQDAATRCWSRLMRWTPS
jgi:hypothetical protein